MRGLVCIGLALVGLVGCHGVSDQRLYTITGDYEDLRVELSNGDLSIEAAEPGERSIRMEADFGGVGGSDAIDRYMDGDTLVIDYRCGFCGGDLELVIPADLPVDAYVRRGDLSLEGLSASVLAEVETGAIEGTHLTADVEAFVNAGGIELEFDDRPGLVDVETHVGAVLLEVPSGGYRIDARGHLGAVTLSDVWEDASSEEELRVFNHAGEVRILGNR
jgi:hypothetical protein